MTSDKELHVERDGLELNVARKGNAITFFIGYGLFSTANWTVKRKSTKKALLVNLEEAMGHRNVLPAMETRIVSPVKQVQVNFWRRASRGESDRFTFLMQVNWDWQSTSTNFRQTNSADIFLTTEEVEILHRIFKGD